jgi:hypothetical protein
MHAAPTVEDAVEPGSDVLVVPDALNTLLVGGDAEGGTDGGGSRSEPRSGAGPGQD